MYRALRRAGWALAAAAGLGLVAPAWTPAAPPAPVYQEITEVGPVIVQEHVIAAPDTHLAVINVELAWLADALTCPYHLTLHVEGGSAHVRGYVQNKTAREKAVRLAREHCMLEVIDELKIHPRMVIPVMAPAEPLKPAEAEAALKATLSGPATSFHVTCRPDGQVRVTGTVPSLEDKLAVSRRLRALPGCMAVVNELQLHAAPAPPTPGIARNRPQQQPQGPQHASRPPAQAMPVGSPITEKTPAREQPAEPWVAVTKAPARDSGTLAPPAPAPTPATPAAEATSGPMVPNTDLLAQLQNRVERMCGKAATDLHLVPKSRRDLLIQLTVRDDDTAAILSERILTLPELARYHVDLDVKVSDLDPAASRTPAAATSLAPAPPALPKTNTIPATSPLTRPTVSASTAHPPAKVSQEPRPPVSPPATSSPTSAMAVLAGPPPTPVFLEGMANQNESLSPMRSLSQPDFPTPPARASSLPGATNANAPLAVKSDLPGPKKMNPVEGVVYKTTDSRKADAKTVPAVTLPPPADPARLKESIQRSCGQAASEVRVQLRAADKVLVQFKATNEQEGERLAAKVMALPELAAYHVDLDVSVADEPIPPPPVSSVAWHPVAATKSPLKATAAAPAVPAAVPAASKLSQRASEASKDAAGYASTGVVVLAEAAPTLPAGLQERLQKACGSRAEVRAVARSATDVQLELKAHSAAEAERLTNVLLNLPELRPFKVDVDVTLVP